MAPFTIVEIGHIDRVRASYERLHPRLWHVLYAYSGDRDVATDAEAEAFAQVLRRGDEVRDIDAWVWRSAFLIVKGLLAAQPLELVVAEVPETATTEVDSMTEFVSLDPATGDAVDGL